MKNTIDTPLSEEVAKQAGKKINNLKKEVEENKDLQNSILRDFVTDTRVANKFIKKICVTLIVLLFFSVGGMIGLSIYNQNLIRDYADAKDEEMFDLLRNTEFETSIEMMTQNQSENHGNITLNK